MLCHQLRIAGHVRKISICCRYVKAAASILLVLGIITAAANVWCLGPINQQYIPQAVRQAEIALERKVRLTGIMVPMLAVPQILAVIFQSLSGARLWNEAGCKFSLVRFLLRFTCWKQHSGCSSLQGMAQMPKILLFGAGRPGEGAMGGALRSCGLWAAGISGSSQPGSWCCGEVQPGAPEHGGVRGPAPVAPAGEADCAAAC